MTQAPKKSAETPLYRPDIDGLRAISVIAVVLYHAFPTLLPGGYLGVDVFFVISGYLITGNVLRDLVGKRFSLSQFYARRVLRIVPALAVVIAATFAIGWLVMLPTEFRQLGAHIVGGSLFFLNFQLWMETGYFDKASELKPLLHLWSLSVEEQFYLVWPMLLMWLPPRRSSVLSLISAVALLSFGTQVLLSQNHPSAAFYLSFARFWELMVGAGLAAWSSKPDSISQLINQHTRFGQSGTILGLVLIIVSVGFGGAGTAASAVWRLLPTTGALLVLWSGMNAELSRSVLRGRSLVEVGRISYPIYLWHWPLLAFLHLIRGSEASWLSRLAVIAISFGLAWLTNAALERPIRFGRYRAHAVPVLYAALLGLSVVGLVDFDSQGFPSRLPEPLRKYTAVTYDWAAGARVGKCWLATNDAYDGFDPECSRSLHPEKRSVLIWGDSHAGRLYPGFSTQYEGRINLLQLTRDSCPPVLNYGYETCRKSNDYVLSLIRKSPPDLVVLFAVWNAYASDYSGSEIAHDLDATLEQLRDVGVKNVWVIGPAPQWTKDLPRILAEYWRNQYPLGDVPWVLSYGLSPLPARVDTQMHDDISPMLADFVSLLKLLCNRQGCKTRVSEGQEGLVTADYGHFTAAGAEYIARLLAPKLDRELDLVAGQTVQKPSDDSSVR